MENYELNLFLKNLNFKMKKATKSFVKYFKIAFVIVIRYYIAIAAIVVIIHTN